MTINYIDVPFELKSSQELDDGYFRFEGLASTFSTDLGNDRIEPGAFRESIAKNKPVILFQHDQSSPIGVTDEIRETMDGLFIKARLPKDDELVKGRIIPQMKIGSLNSMSIGFRMSQDDFEFDDGVRVIKRLQLPEVSLVTFPMNPEAKVTGFKSVAAAKDLPLASEDCQWDQEATLTRLREITGSEERPSEQYKSAFFWHDTSKTDDFTSYHLPFADVIDGKLTAVPRGVNAAFAAMSDAQGGITIPASDRPAVQSVINDYRKKMKMNSGARTEKEKCFYTIGEVKKIKTLREFETLLRNTGCFSRDAATYITSQYSLKQSESEKEEDTDVNTKDLACTQGEPAEPINEIYPVLEAQLLQMKLNQTLRRITTKNQKGLEHVSRKNSNDGGGHC